MKNPLDKTLRWSRRLQFVPRWVVMPTVHKQYVDQHTFHMAQTCRWLLCLHASGDRENFRLAVLEAALDHDMDEAITGDRPSPSKPVKPAPTDQLDIVLKCADLLEALAFTWEEEHLGNKQWMLSVQEDVSGKFNKIWTLFNHNKFSPRADDPHIVLDKYKEQILPRWNKPHPVLE